MGLTFAEASAGIGAGVGSVDCFEFCSAKLALKPIRKITLHVKMHYLERGNRRPVLIVRLQRVQKERLRHAVLSHALLTGFRSIFTTCHFPVVPAAVSESGILR
jgi:hypothetical protein